MMALRDAPRDLEDLLAVRYVADLGFAGEPSGYLLEAVAPPRQENAAPAPGGQLAGERGADPARGSGDDRDANGESLYGRKGPVWEPS